MGKPVKLQNAIMMHDSNHVKAMHFDQSHMIQDARCCRAPTEKVASWQAAMTHQFHLDVEFNLNMLLQIRIAAGR